MVESQLNHVLGSESLDKAQNFSNPPFPHLKEGFDGSIVAKTEM